MTPFQRCCLPFVFAATSYEEIQLELTVPDPMNYRMLPRFFAFNGDADGDGYTNQQEYDYFMPLGGATSTSRPR